MHKNQRRVAVLLTALMGTACAARAVKKEAPLVETAPYAGPIQTRRVVDNSSKKEKAAKKPEKRSVKTLLAELKDNNKRYSAMYELGESDLSSLDKSRAEGVKDSVLEAMRFDSEVVIPGIKVLGLLADESTVMDLAAYSRSRQHMVRNAVADALGNIPSADSVYVLIDLMGDRNQTVERAAVESLGKIGSLAARHLAPVLANGNPDRQYAAVEALSRIGPGAVLHVLPLLGHPDSKAVYHAVSVLGNIADKSAVQDLMGLMSHPDNNVRGTAANALRKIGDKSSLTVLAQVAENDSSDFVRAAAKHAVDSLSQ